MTVVSPELLRDREVKVSQVSLDARVEVHHSGHFQQIDFSSILSSLTQSNIL